MEIIGTLASRQVGDRSHVEEQRKWQDWELIAKALSLEEEKLLVSLGPQAKALLFWMHAGLINQPRIQLEVHNTNLDAIRLAVHVRGNTRYF